MKILVTICARGGSKGVKDKNIRLVAGKPLIAHTIETAKKWGKAARIVCSTDSEKIATIAKEYGAKVPFMRPMELASDTSGKLGAIRHALSTCEEIYGERYDVVIDLDVTNPLRKPADIDGCLEEFEKGDIDVVFTVVESRKSPYFNMVEIGSDGFAHVSKQPPKELLRRQDAPKTYDMNTSIYVLSRSFLVDTNNKGVFSTGKTRIRVMDPITAFDIDKESDFDYVTYLMEKGVYK